MTTTSGDDLPGISSRSVLGLRLFVVGGAPESERALVHLRDLLEREYHGRYSLEVVDVLEESWRSHEEGVLLTPTLVRYSPLPVARIVGDVTDEARLRSLLSGHGGETGDASRDG